MGIPRGLRSFSDYARAGYSQGIKIAKHKKNVVERVGWPLYGASLGVAYHGIKMGKKYNRDFFGKNQSLF